MDVLTLIISCLVVTMTFAYLVLTKRKCGDQLKYRDRLGIRVVCISDTHGDHRKLSDSLPRGDVLIHAGDFTRFGKLEHAQDFNLWLAEMKAQNDFQQIIVVNGNHESNVSLFNHYPL